jgi:hypothetical protein
MEVVIFENVVTEYDRLSSISSIAVFLFEVEATDWDDFCAN